MVQLNGKILMSRKLVLSITFVGSLMLLGCQGMDPTPISVDQTPPNFSALSNKIISTEVAKG